MSVDSLDREATVGRDGYPDYTAALTGTLDRTDPFEIDILLGGQPPAKPIHSAHFGQLSGRDRQKVIEYSAELDCLHEDLQFCLSELSWLSQDLNRTGEVSRTRLALLYHRDNFHFRLHAYREKAFKLVNHWLSPGVPDEPYSNFNQRVLGTLKEAGSQGGLSRETQMRTGWHCRLRHGFKSNMAPASGTRPMSCSRWPMCIHSMRSLSRSSIGPLSNSMCSGEIW